MLEKIAGVAVLTGLLLSVVGAVMGYEDIKTAGNLMLLIIATVAGYRYLKFYATTPTGEFLGTCIEQKRFSSHYILTFKTGGTGTYSGRAGLQTGDKIKIGEKARVKVKGNVILEIYKL